MYERHYKTDNHFGGTRGWSGKALGLERYGPLAKVWHAMPPELKQSLAGLTGGMGGLLDFGQDDATRRVEHIEDNGVTFPTSTLQTVENGPNPNSRRSWR